MTKWRVLTTLLLLAGLAALTIPATSGAQAEATCSPPPDGTLSPYWSPSVSRWARLIVHHAGRQGLDPDLVAAVMRHESAGNPTVVSSAGAVGLMQVMPFETGFPTRPTAAALRDPNTNINRGTLILTQVIRHAQGDVRAALGAYNGGWGNYDHATPQAYAGWVLADYGRALAARRCRPTPEGSAFAVVRGAPAELAWLAETGCVEVFPPAYKQAGIVVYPVLSFCRGPHER